MWISLKKKPLLRELIPEDAVDIHNHVLPGIDDGAKDTAHTLALLEGMRDLGYKSIIATPHTMQEVYENTSETIRSSFEGVVSIAKELSLELSYASEYMLDAGFKDRIGSGLLTLKENMVLVELSFLQPINDLFELLFELQIKGYRPILAHPERYQYYGNQFDQFEKLKDSGCMFQMNLLSAVGHYGPDVSKIADKLLKAGMIDLAGSDIHHTHHLKSFHNKVVLKEYKILEKALERTKDIFS
jgi:tyrosine-protein phosphatase YwqE